MISLAKFDIDPYIHSVPLILSGMVSSLSANTLFLIFLFKCDYTTWTQRWIITNCAYSVEADTKISPEVILYLSGIDLCVSTAKAAIEIKMAKSMRSLKKPEKHLFCDIQLVFCWPPGKSSPAKKSEIMRWWCTRLPFKLCVTAFIYENCFSHRIGCFA